MIDKEIYKNISSEELISILNNAICDYSVFPSRVSGSFPNNAELSDRELSVLRLVCDGYDRKEIASKIGLSESTVKSNIGSILNKTGYSSISKLAIYLVANNLIMPHFDEVTY